VKITKLVAENVKRLHRVEIEPSGELVIVRGENGAGKSSILDAIKYAMAGKSSHPPKVIREGERQAVIELTTEDFVVTRRWVAGAEATTTEVEVRATDGTKLPSPQKVLDKLFDELAFDALEFATMKPGEQLELLKKLVGVDTTILDRERDKTFAARTMVKRDLDAVEARLKAMPTDKPPPAVDVGALQVEQRKARDLLSEAKEARENELAATARRVEDRRGEVRTAELALEQAKARLQESIKAAAAADNRADDAEEKAQGAVERVAELDKQIAAASASATANAKWAERTRLSAEVEMLSKDHASKTKAIDAIDEQKTAMIAAAKFPIDGLGFGEDGVVYRGPNSQTALPFEQASQAEQLRVSVAIGAARKPKFRVMTVREGSRLDRKGLKLLGELAKERDIQVWLEAVGEDGPAAVVIVDGVVARREVAA